MEPLWQYVASIDWRSWLDLLPDQVWSIWTVGGGLLLVGGLIAWRGLLQDRSRGRPRCPRCWYDMRSLPERRCPECGFAPKSPAGLLRTRRYWRQGGLGLGLFFAGAFIFTSSVVRHGWYVLIPTRILIDMAPTGASVSPYIPVGIELIRRDADLSLSSADWKRLLAPSRYLVHRPKWLHGTALYLEPRFPFWMRNVVIVVRGFDESRAEVDRYSDCLFSSFESRRGEYIAPGPAPEEIEIRVLQKRGFAPGPAGAAALIWQGRATLPIRFTDRIEDIIRPVVDPAMNEKLRRELKPALEYLGHDVTFHAPDFELTLQPSPGAIPADMHADIRVELLFRDPKSPPIRFSRFAAGAFESATVWHAQTSVTAVELTADRGWVLRIRGDAAAALRQQGRERFWAGVVDFNPGEVLIRSVEHAAASTP